MISENDVVQSIICGPDADRYIDKLQEHISAGYDQVWLHQVGPDQEGFFKFFEQMLLPKLRRKDLFTV